METIDLFRRLNARAAELGHIERSMKRDDPLLPLVNQRRLAMEDIIFQAVKLAQRSIEEEEV